MAVSARRSCGRFEEKPIIKDVEKKAEGAGQKQMGTITKRLDLSLASAGREAAVVQNVFAPVAFTLFQQLAWPLQQSTVVRRDKSLRNYMPLDLTDRDLSICAQIIVTLSVFISCAGPQCLERDQIATELIKISLNRMDSTGTKVHPRFLCQRTFLQLD